MKTNLPSNWISSSLTDVTSFLSRGISPKYVEQGGIEVINQKCIRDHKVNREPSRRHDISAKSVPENKTVQMWDGLVNSTGVGTLGRVAQVTELLEQTTVDSHVTIVRPKKDLFHEPFFGLMLRKIEQEIEQLGRGAVGQIELPRTQLASLIVTYPESKNEQQKIVDKIEELFSVIDAVQGSISQVIHSTSNFETSLVRAAFSGELSGDFSNNDNQDLEHFVKTNNIKPLDYNSSFFTYDIPKNWKWVKFSDIADIKGGIAKNSNAKVTESVSLPYLRVANVQRGYFDLDEIKEIKIPKDRVNDLLLKNNDILLTEGGDRDKLGRGWVWESQIDPCTHQNHIFRARISDQRINPWLISTFVNELGKWYFMKEGKQTTNLASISLTKLRNLPVPLIPFEEAEFIFSELQALRSELSNTNDQTRMDLLRIKKLKHSILKQAFEGKLV